MTKKRKIQIHIGAVFVMLCLAGWIAVLYTEQYREGKSRENEYLTRYQAVLNDLVFRIGEFEEADNYNDQILELERITNELTQLKAHMEMYIHLAALEGGKASGSDMSGETEVYQLIWLLNNGGQVDSSQIEAFRADGFISEEESAVIGLLKEEAEELLRDLVVLDGDGGTYHYELSSVEVYERLTEIMQNTQKQLAYI